MCWDQPNSRQWLILEFFNDLEDWAIFNFKSKRTFASSKSRKKRKQMKKPKPTNFIFSKVPAINGFFSLLQYNNLGFASFYFGESFVWSLTICNIGNFFQIKKKCFVWIRILNILCSCPHCLKKSICYVGHFF